MVRPRRHQAWDEVVLGELTWLCPFCGQEFKRDSHDLANLRNHLGCNAVDLSKTCRSIPPNEINRLRSLFGLGPLGVQPLAGPVGPVGETSSAGQSASSLWARMDAEAEDVIRKAVEKKKQSDFLLEQLMAEHFLVKEGGAEFSHEKAVVLSGLMDKVREAFGL